MKKSTIIIGAIVIALIGTISWTLASNKEVIDSRKQINTTESKVTVTVALTEQRETSSYIQLVGTAEANKEVNIASEGSGKIVQMQFKMGDYIEKGKVVAQIDDTYKRLAYKNAEINYKKYKEDLERYQVLLKGDAVSETQLRDIQISYDNAAIQLENAKKQWDDTKIEAQFSGFITSKSTELGAYVNAGTVIAAITDISQLKVMLSVSESVAYQLKKEQDVSITAEVYPGEVFKGTISNISPKGSATHTYPVEIQIANNNKNQLKAGTYLNVSVDLAQSEKALMIPRDAIVSSVKDPSVYLLKGETVQLIKITTGRSFDNYLEVISGLNEGDQVVTNGQINLMDGAKVTVIN